jgi:hypothetical protein
VNIILLLDNSPIWRTDAGGASLVQRHIDAIVACKAVQRLAISAHPTLSEDQRFYRVPLYTVSNQKIRYWIRYSEESAQDQVYDIMREMGWDRALVLGSFSPYLFTFMLDEVFSGAENREYGLRQISWGEVVSGDIITNIVKQESRLSIAPDDIYYAYSEVIKGAAWEEVLEEIDGKQGSLPIEYGAESRSI